MPGQMCWLAKLGSDGTKTLHLRQHQSDPWQPYTALRQFGVKDYQVPGGSKGWATYQKLRAAGWEVVASEQPKFSTPQPAPVR